MATVVMTPRKTKVQPDRFFFPLMCLLVLVTVWLGFSKTYYAVGLVRAPLPNPLVHVHAVIFSLWLVTLTLQTALVSARKVKVHMAVGLWGFALAALMVIIGTSAAINSLHRDMSPPGSGLSPLTFFIVPLSGMLVFATFTGWSYAVRRKPDQHKRLIMFASIALLDAAVGRFPYTIAPHMGPLGQMLTMFSFLVVMAGYDLISTRRIHRVTALASLIIIVEQVARIPLAQTAPWQAFARLIHG
jgi:hypothetical protein